MGCVCISSRSSSSSSSPVPFYTFASPLMYSMSVLSSLSSPQSLKKPITLSSFFLPPLPSSSSKSHARVTLPHHPIRLLRRRRQKQNRLTKHITNNHQHSQPYARPCPPTPSTITSSSSPSSPQRHQPPSIHHLAPMCLQVRQQRRAHHRKHHRSISRAPSLPPSPLSPKPRLVQLL